MMGSIKEVTFLARKRDDISPLPQCTGTNFEQSRVNELPFAAFVVTLSTYLRTIAESATRAVHRTRPGLSYRSNLWQLHPTGARASIDLDSIYHVTSISTFSAQEHPKEGRHFTSQVEPGVLRGISACCWRSLRPEGGRREKHEYKLHRIVKKKPSLQPPPMFVHWSYP